MIDSTKLLVKHLEGLNMNYQQQLDIWAKRAAHIRELRAKDPAQWTYRALGAKYDISPQRVEQICKKAIV